MNKLIEYRGYHGSCEVSIEDDCLHGRIQFIDDLITYEGETPKKIQDAFQAAVDRYIAHCEKTGKPANKPCSGTFNVRIGPDLHRKVIIAAKSQRKNLNEFVRDALQSSVETNGVAKVEHIHQHYVTVASTPAPETRVATMQEPSQWEEIRAKFH